MRYVLGHVKNRNGKSKYIRVDKGRYSVVNDIQLATVTEDSKETKAMLDLTPLALIYEHGDFEVVPVRIIEVREAVWAKN